MAGLFLFCQMLLALLSLLPGGTPFAPTNGISTSSTRNSLISLVGVDSKHGGMEDKGASSTVGAETASSPCVEQCR